MFVMLGHLPRIMEAFIKLSLERSWTVNETVCVGFMPRFRSLCGT